MIAQEIYKFNRNNYNDDGFNIEDGSFLMDTVKEWEMDFHKKHPVCYANYLFSNDSTMILFNKCLNLDSNENCGMDLIEGQIDLDTNLKIEEYSQSKIIYGIGSEIEENKDEPLFLVINEKIIDGTVVLKYIPDDDSDEVEIPVPTESDKIKVK